MITSQYMTYMCWYDVTKQKVTKYADLKEMVGVECVAETATTDRYPIMVI